MQVHKDDLLCFLPEVLGLAFISMIHFELIFTYGTKLLKMCLWILIVPALFVGKKKPILPPLSYIALLEQ